MLILCSGKFNRNVDRCIGKIAQCTTWYFCYPATRHESRFSQFEMSNYLVNVYFLFSVIDYSVQPETLAQYRGTEPHIYIGKARRGRYYLELWSPHQRQTYFLYVTMNPMTVELLNRFKEKKHKPMTFKKNLRNSSLTFKWPEWWVSGLNFLAFFWGGFELRKYIVICLRSWRNEEIMYVVAWHNEKYITSGCELEFYSFNSEVRYLIY